MDELFPSEVARLVLGYLKESKCEKAWKIFLEESSGLREYCELYKRGKLYPTNVNGKSLLDILNEYCILKRDSENNYNNEFSGSAFKEKCKMILEEVVTNAAEHVLLKYFPSVSGNNQRRLQDSSALDVTKIIHTSELRDENCIEYGNTVEKSGESANNNHIPENDPHNFDSNVELNITECNTNQSCEQSVSGVNVTSHCLSLTESSVSDSIYLHEIIKVEKDNDSFSVTENSPEKNTSAVKQKSSNVLGENLSDANSIPEHNKNADKTIESKETNSMEVEIIKTVKLEPCSEVNSNQNETDMNCIQNSSVITSQNRSLVEISQTALCEAQGTIDHFSNLMNNISFSTNQSGYALQTAPFSNQPVAVNDLSFPSVPTYIMPNYSSNIPYMQNNAQYSFIINTPTPWKDTAGSGFTLNLPSVQPNNTTPVLTSIDSVASNGTPSVPKVCVNNVLSPAITDVDSIITNTPSNAGVSINIISNPALTTAACENSSLTASSVPSNVSSFVNTWNDPIQTIPNLNMVVPDSANGKLVNKHTSDKVPKQKKNKNASLKEKEMNNDLEIQSSGKNPCNKSKKKLPMPPLSSFNNGKKTSKKNSIPNNANSQLQSRAVQPKKTTRRKGK